MELEIKLEYITQWVLGLWLSGDVENELYLNEKNSILETVDRKWNKIFKILFYDIDNHLNWNISDECLLRKIEKCRFGADDRHCQRMSRDNYN